MCIVVSSIGCGTITKRIKTAVAQVVWMPENHHKGSRSLPVAMCQTLEDTNSVIVGVAALCCRRKTHIPLNVSRRLHERGLFARRPVDCVPLSPERGCIGLVNITVGYQSSGATYSLRMSLDLTSRTIPEGQ
ncbi:hypothetical protein AVEN_3225-1 [Araneus ventricosus]|uniref:Uncharacterized protein n=1 Tax=Araneus ventricosus TaxID=182803 RepID=A0A4Y2G7E3_ARAVE|nr:hypothetical protein AVEN_3225-1 [Araneus ventricosus]